MKYNSYYEHFSICLFNIAFTVFRLVLEVIIMLDHVKVGIRIKKARIDKKMTQGQLSERLELSNNYISSIERGNSIPSLETFIRICNALDVTADMLLTDTLYRSNEYIKDSIAVKLEKCNKINMRIVERFIDMLIEENT